MKLVKLALMVAVLAPMGAAMAADAQPEQAAAAAATVNAPTPLEICQSKNAFAYHFDMMQIESQEISGRISHDDANRRKMNRSMVYQGDDAVCVSENKKD